MNVFFKVTNIPRALRIKLSPCFNRWKFKQNNIIMGRNPIIMGRVFIRNRGRMIIGNRFCYTSGDFINPISGNECGAIYIEPSASIIIGDRVGMSSTKMWIRESLTIGNNVHVGANTLLIDTDTHQLDYRLRRDFDDEVFNGDSVEVILQKKEAAIKSAPIIIEDDVWIGANCIILKGVTIGARSIIGAGSIVTQSIPADCIAAGNPCRIIRSI